MFIFQKNIKDRSKYTQIYKQYKRKEKKYAKKKIIIKKKCD